MPAAAARRSECVEPVDRARRGCELGVGPSSIGTAVVRLQHGQPERPRAVRVERLREGREVAERLRHLLAADLDHPAVDPVACERVAGGLGLRALVLVVREHEVVAAAVEVEALAEESERHRRALDVPAGPPRTPRRVPRRLAGLRRLPEREVDRVALCLVDLDARAGGLEQLLERAVRQGRRSDGKVATSKYTPPLVTVDHVGVPTVDELGR